MRIVTLGVLLALSGCASCRRSESAPVPVDAAVPVVAEALPRCRADGPKLTFSGTDVVVGDVAVTESAVYVGVVHGEGARRIQSVARAGLDLSEMHVVDVGDAFGDDPPPSPRVSGGVVRVALVEREKSDAGRMRVLRVVRLGDGVGPTEATIVQQPDESTAYDVAWSGAAGLAAWDEDAPANVDAGKVGADRGFVKVQRIGDGSRPRVASPETTDAESPRLLARPGGFWLAWLARRPEEELYGVEGPGEPRAFRWVEVIPLDARGEAAGPVRRVSPERGRAVAFELATIGSDLVVVVQDEAAHREGAGARLVRYVLKDRLDFGDLVDGGVGHAIVDVVESGGKPRWLAWSDVAEHTHVAPLGDGLVAGQGTIEPALDHARVVAATPPDVVYAVVTPAAGAAPELRRVTCR
jgi:hypothetical protein